MPSSSTYHQILGAVQTAIQGLSLTGINSTSVVLQKVPRDNPGDLPALPGVIVAPYGPISHSPTAGTVMQDEYGYPVLVALVRAGNESQSANFDTHLYQQELIIKAFINQRLTAVPVVMRCVVEPKASFDPASFFKNLDASVTVLRFITREDR